MRPSLLILTIFFVFVLTCVPKAMSATPSQLAAVSGTLNVGETKDFTYSLPRDLEDFLLHVVVTADAPQTDTLDITIEGAKWTDLQGDWWDYWEHYLAWYGPLTAGEHTLTAAIGPNATGPISFNVQFLDVPNPPFKVQGNFLADAYNDFAYIHVNLPKGNCSVAADATTGAFTLFPEGLDTIDVSGPINQTLHFPDAGVYEFVIQTDPAGPSSWSITFGDAVIPEFPQASLALLLPAVLAITFVLVRRRGGVPPAP